MSGNNTSEKTVSDAQSATTDEHAGEVTHEPTERSTCPECEGQVVTKDETSFCTACGLVVADEWVDRSPTLNDLGMVGEADKSIETVDPLQADKGLATKMGQHTDGHGNPLSNERWDRVQTLRKWHKRFRFGGQRKRTKRCNEGLRDIEMIGANLALPEYVVKTAAQYLRRAADAHLPGGRMAWESLAGGAVLLAVRASDIERADIDSAVAAYTKAPRERVCAAARKIRCQCEVDAPVVRPNAVMAVLDALDEEAIPGARAVRTWRLACYLLELGDQVPVGPGTSRCTVAAAALYGADRLLPGKHVTQGQVAEAAATVVPTSKCRVAQYSRELVDTYKDEHSTDDPAVGLRHARGSQH